MQNIINWALASLVFIASFACYAMGNASGGILLLAAGFLLEFAFWLHCFKKEKCFKLPF